jgi:hypothetical protein
MIEKLKRGVEKKAETWATVNLRIGSKPFYYMDAAPDAERTEAK